MLRLAFDFIITWRETRTRPNAYQSTIISNDILDIKLINYTTMIQNPCLLNHSPIKRSYIM